MRTLAWKKTAAVVALTATAALGLSACGSSQSVTDACAKLKSNSDAVSSDLKATPSDPSQIGALADKMKSAVEKMGDGVTNAEVKANLDKFSTAVNGYADLLKSNASDPAKALTDSSAKDKLQAVTDSTKAITDQCKFSIGN